MENRVNKIEERLGRIEEKIVDIHLNVSNHLSEVTGDVAWLKRFFWAVITPALGIIIAGLMGLILTK